MNQITVGSSLGEQLIKLPGGAVLCDASGRALGLFSPLSQPMQAGELQLEPPLSIAETEELRKVRTGKPLNEILERLGLK
jgi:hypothetical protein